MITIRDIYQWYNKEFTDSPHYPPNMTPLQALEWNEQNSQKIRDLKNSIKSRSFVGELLVDAPAVIGAIDKNKISALSYYIKIKMNEYHFEKQKYNPNNSRWGDDHELGVKYE